MRKVLSIIVFVVGALSTTPIWAPTVVNFIMKVFATPTSASLSGVILIVLSWLIASTGASTKKHQKKIQEHQKTIQQDDAN